MNSQTWRENRRIKIAQIGSDITLKSGQKYRIAGDWTPRAGQLVDGYVILSSKAPIAELLIGKRVGDTVSFGKIDSEITAIERTDV